MLLNTMTLVFQHRMTALDAASSASTSSIVPFYGIPHLVQRLRVQTSALERDALLALLGALVTNRANAQAFIRCGGVKLLVALAAIVHVDRQGSSKVSMCMISRLQQHGPGSVYRCCLPCRDGRCCWALLLRCTCVLSRAPFAPAGKA